MFTNWLAPPTTTLPPDTIIEVGPPPFTRYAAHSALVSVHSGYLRAALRSDSLAANADTMQIYVPNVTADQFTPLLTYMYTGFLDLNIENIFGVLLATHILHMPRALELCRSFLSATQTENYFGGLNALSSAGASDVHSLSKLKPELETSKVVRPIASKATGIGLNFIAPPASHILFSSTHTPFKSLSTVVGTSPAVIVENAENSSPPPGNAKIAVLAENPVSTGQRHGDVDDKSPKESNQKRQSKSLKRSSNKSESVVTTTTTKDSRVVDKGVIIDIASCDGPVRFRRVLNDSYGMNSNSNNVTPPDDSKAVSRYMSSSFHQQMVRNINERKQSLSMGESFSCASNKDENSQDNNQSQSSQQSTASGAAAGETYNCVYCKHTFKSQYCYQKHAKRHLIPLSLEASATSMAVTDYVGITEADKDASGPRCEKSGSKREVKPLDMNVQYYPCKTCGSKFPSYYFVHKHRKMCHAEEEIL
ncbi:zinc finger and BTB domain-containing protein 8B [Ochlerotatus camptorhynchus]|uniref:zinc finger and BTB domain-containing protein 8B n=1 Tax=Ochlerotatus camptorhynchus TaxID=644619 RepID=UPI0031CE9FD9